jgi:hypothetical protein
MSESVVDNSRSSEGLAARLPLLHLPFRPRPASGLATYRSRPFSVRIPDAVRTRSGRGRDAVFSQSSRVCFGTYLFKRSEFMPLALPIPPNRQPARFVLPSMSMKGGDDLMPTVSIATASAPIPRLNTAPHPPCNSNHLQPSASTQTKSALRLPLATSHFAHNFPLSPPLQPSPQQIKPTTSATPSASLRLRVSTPLLPLQNKPKVRATSPSPAPNSIFASNPPTKQTHPALFPFLTPWNKSA